VCVGGGCRCLCDTSVAALASAALSSNCLLVRLSVLFVTRRELEPPVTQLGLFARVRGMWAALGFAEDPLRRDPQILTRAMTALAMTGVAVTAFAVRNSSTLLLRSCSQARCRC
jgi:uncharacterized lipoprotein YddW (UPF0748 family)